MHSKSDSLRKERCSNWDLFALSPPARRSCSVLPGWTGAFCTSGVSSTVAWKVPLLFLFLVEQHRKQGKKMKIQTYPALLTIFGLLFVNWTWFFLPSVSYICVIMELLLVVAFLANIAGSGRSPMNLRMTTHTTREACSGRKHSQKLPREPMASCHFFLFRREHLFLLRGSSC